MRTAPPLVPTEDDPFPPLPVLVVNIHQDAGASPFPHSVDKIHQDGRDACVPFASFPHSVDKIHQDGRDHMFLEKRLDARPGVF